MGLVGGLGVGAAVHYYRELARMHEERGVTLDLAMAHAETWRVLEKVQAGDRGGLARYFEGFIRRLQAAGAEVAVLPSVTSHYCLTELDAISPLPVINIFEPLNRELKRLGARRLGVFGTRFVMQSRMYGRVPDVEFVAARPEETEYIHRTYLELANDGQGTAEQFADLTKLGLELCRREKLDAIVMGGTDLSLLFHAGNTAFPAVDCAQLHVREIVAQVVG